MVDDKPKPLEVDQSEVKPVELPDKGTQYGPEREREETEQDAQVDTRPRAERRRSHKEKAKEEKAMRQQIKKVQQQMARPLRHRDMQLIVNQVMMALRPMTTRMQEEIDKLSYLPDYINEKLEANGIILQISIADFEEWFKALKAKLEAGDASEEDVGSPETEETQ